MRVRFAIVGRGVLAPPFIFHPPQHVYPPQQKNRSIPPSVACRSVSMNRKMYKLKYCKNNAQNYITHAVNGQGYIFDKQTRQTNKQTNTHKQTRLKTSFL